MQAWNISVWLHIFSIIVLLGHPAPALSRSAERWHPGTVLQRAQCNSSLSPTTLKHFCMWYKGVYHLHMYVVCMWYVPVNTICALC